MIRLVQNTTPMIQLSTEISCRQSLSKTDVTINKNENAIDSLSPQYESSRLTHDNRNMKALLVLGKIMFYFNFSMF